MRDPITYDEIALALFVTLRKTGRLSPGNGRDLSSDDIDGGSLSSLAADPQCPQDEHDNQADSKVKFPLPFPDQVLIQIMQHCIQISPCTHARLAYCSRWQDSITACTIFEVENDVMSEDACSHFDISYNDLPGNQGARYQLMQD